MEQKIISNTILINAPKEKIWDALTLPELTRKYMFGSEAISGWKAGDSLLWRGQYEGRDMIFVKGFIRTIEPGRLLEYTVIDPQASYPDTPENHLTVRYELNEIAGSTRLSVSQYGFETAADGAKRYEDVYNKGEGWSPILSAIRNLVENEM